MSRDPDRQRPACRIRQRIRRLTDINTGAGGEIAQLARHNAGPLAVRAQQGVEELQHPWMAADQPQSLRDRRFTMRRQGRRSGGSFLDSSAKPSGGTAMTRSSAVMPGRG